MRRGIQATEVSIATVLAVVFLALVAPAASFLRLVVSVPLVFILPGLAILSAWDPKRELGRVERFTISVALSISLTIGLGMLLALSPMGLSTGGCLLMLSVVTFAGNALALSRGAEDFRSPEGPSATLRPLLPIAVSLAAVALLVGITLAGGTYRPSSGELVQLWMLPDAAETSGRVKVGATRRVSDTSRFRLEYSQGSTTASDTQFELEPGQSMAFPVELPAGTPDTASPLTARLTGVDTPTQSRSVTRWPR